MKRAGISSFFTGLPIALIFSVVSVFIFGVIVSVFPVSPWLIKPVNGVIKAVSAFLGAMICVKGGKGLIKGAVFGAVFFIASYLLFGAIAGKLSFGLNLLFDPLICAISGAVAGVIRSNA